MIRSIKWSSVARQDYYSVVDYLIEEWGNKAAETFIDDVSLCLYQIQRMPLIFPAFENRKDVRYCVINKHTKLYYLIRPTQIILITFFHTGRNPEKLRI
jgi:plasmid stabilization system protein ParE